MKPLELILTGDGSHSLFIPDLDETYHSRHGAVQESSYVFIEKGFSLLVEKKPEEISILEVGMGTGLNVWLSIIESQNTDQKVSMTTLEPFPLNPELIRKLNYVSNCDEDQARLFLDIHDCKWELPVEITSLFSLVKKKELIQSYVPDKKFTLIYYDAFAPSKQEDMWTREILFKMSDLSAPGAVFVTYCAKGQLKRDLREAGFEVETLPGPPGKNEMVRGIKKA